MTPNIDDFEKTRDKFVGTTLAAFIVIGLLALGASLYRATVIGWQPVMTVHVVFWIALAGVFVFRRHLNFRVRAWFIIGVLIVIGISGLLTFGLVSVSFMAFLVASVLATVLFGFGPGLVVATFVLAVIAAVGVGVAFEWVTFDFDIAKYTVAPVSWFTFFAASVLFISLCIFGLSRIHNSLMRSLHQMGEKSEQLENEIERRKQSEQALSEHKIHLEDLVEKRTRDLLIANQQAEQAKIEAIAANNSKSDFLADMNHELRSPLTAKWRRAPRSIPTRARDWCCERRGQPSVDCRAPVPREHNREPAPRHKGTSPGEWPPCGMTALRTPASPTRRWRRPRVLRPDCVSAPASLAGRI